MLSALLVSRDIEMGRKTNESHLSNDGNAQSSVRWTLRDMFGAFASVVSIVKLCVNSFRFKFRRLWIANLETLPIPALGPARQNSFVKPKLFDHNAS